MLVVMVCSLANLTMLVGLAAGIVIGFWRGRTAIAGALAFDPLACEPLVRQRPAGEQPARLRLA